MFRRPLNARNLETLGAARRAALVMDLVQGSAALQRQARMAPSAAQGPAETVAAIRNRFVSLRAHLKLLPDFDDIETETAAFAHPDFGAALSFPILERSFNPGPEAASSPHGRGTSRLPEDDPARKNNPDHVEEDG